MVTDISINPATVATFCQQNHIRKLAFFGSVLRGDFRAERGVDVLA